MKESRKTPNKIERIHFKRETRKFAKKFVDLQSKVIRTRQESLVSEDGR